MNTAIRLDNRNNELTIEELKPGQMFELNHRFGLFMRTRTPAGFIDLETGIMLHAKDYVNSQVSLVYEASITQNSQQ